MILFLFPQQQSSAAKSITRIDCSWMNLPNRGRFWLKIWPILCLLFVSSVANIALALEPPELKARVNDHAQLLSGKQRNDLEIRLYKYEQRTGHQFVLLTVPSLEGDPIEDFGIRVVERWKLGDKRHQDGLLLLVAKKERRVRIEVGYGLEGAVPDIQANRVIQNYIKPAFKKNQYYNGIVTGFSRLMALAENEAVHEARRPSRSSNPYRWLTKIAPLFIFLVFMAGSFMIPIVFGVIGAVIGSFIHPVLGFFGFIGGLFLGISLIARGGGGGPGAGSGGSDGGGPGFIWIGSGGYGGNYGDSGGGGMDIGGFDGGGGDFGGGGASGDW